MNVVRIRFRPRRRRQGMTRGIAIARRASVLGRVSLHTFLSPSGLPRLRIKLKTHMARESGTKRSRMTVVIFENPLVTKIRRGEQARRQITHDYRLRKLLSAFEFDAALGTSVEKELNVDLEPSWSLSHLGVAAFILNRISLQTNSVVLGYPIARN